MICPRLVVPAVCLLALAASVARADRVDAIAALGAPASGVVALDGSFSVGFLVTQGNGRNLLFSVKRASKASKLVPDAKLYDPDGNLVDIVAAAGKVSKPGAAAWTAKLPDVSKTGLWRLVVSGGGSGTEGGFVVLVKGKDVFKIASDKTAPPTIPVNGKSDVAITAGENTAITIVAAPAKGSSVKPSLSILDANGNPLTGVTPVVNAKTGALTVKAMRLPVFGAYTLRFTGGATGGGFTYSISTAPAKIKGVIPVAVPLPPGTEISAVAADAEPGISRSFAADSGADSYRWTQVSGPKVAMTNATTSTPSFVPPDVDASLAFQLAVEKGGVLSKPATVDVEVGKRPIADAGRSQSVAVSAAVALDGGASLSRSGGPLKFTWRQMPNDPTSVTLTGADTATPSFTAPTTNVKALRFGLIVDDGRVRSGEDVVLVSVGDPTVPVADSGRDQYVPRMASVVLSGLGAHSSSGVLDAGIQWTQVSGPAVTIGNPTMPWASFTAPKANADLQFKLTVGGETATADTAWVHVRASETNLPAPTRGTGPITVPSGAATLAAAATDPDGDTLRFRWAQMQGPPAPVAVPGAAQTTATIAAGANAYLFCAMANDGLQYGSPDFVMVRNSGFNAAPIAIAGADKGGAAGALVTLDGISSRRADGGTSPLAFQWTQMTGKDWFDFTTSAAFNAAATQPNVSLPTDVSSLTRTRTVVFQLVVTDETGPSLPDLVSVTYTQLPANGKPAVTAQISDSNPLPGQTLTLTATATDRDNDAMTFKWTQLSGGTPVTLTGGTTKTATFVAPDSGTLTFSFVANDGFEDSLAATAACTVDRKPVASVVVSPQSGPPGTLVTMDAQSSNDPEGKPLTYQWTQTSGTTINGLNLTGSVITFNAPNGAVSFRLVVNDGRQPSDPKTASFSANQPPAVAPTASRNASNGVSGPAASITAAYGANVTLAANGTGGGGALSYTWRVVSQSPSTMPTITLSSTSSASPTFIVPIPTTSSGPFGYFSPNVSLGESYFNYTATTIPSYAAGPRAVLGVTATDGAQTSSEGTVTVYFYASLLDNTQTSTTIYGTVISSNSCTSCHAGGPTSGQSCPVNSGGSNFNMSSKSAFLGTNRGVSACASGSTLRLPNLGTVGAASNSYLYQRCSGAATPIMPQGTSGLSPVPKNLLKDWIDQGVQDN